MKKDLAPSRGGIIEDNIQLDSMLRSRVFEMFVLVAVNVGAVFLWRRICNIFIGLRLCFISRHAPLLSERVLPVILCDAEYQYLA